MVQTTYGYNAIDELNSEVTSGYNCSYTYDNNGNRLTKTLNGVQTTSTYNSLDEILTSGSNTYHWNGEGRCTSIVGSSGTTSFSYD